MIFPEPITGIDDKGNGIKEVVKGAQTKLWAWTVVKAIPIPEDEQEKYPDPTNPGTFYKYKMDMKNMKRFDKLNFMDAAEELGMIGDKNLNEK